MKILLFGIRLEQVGDMQPPVSDTERLYLVIIIGLTLFLTISAIALWYILSATRKLHEKNREIFDTIQLMVHQEIKMEDHLLNSSLAESETSTQKLYRQLIELMREKKPYTNSELTRENLAQMLGSNSRYVADAIRECSDGMTLSKYLDDWRIRYAAQMLTNTDKPVGIIADMSGFSSRSHFNTLFREKFKMPPTEYRKMAKEILLSGTSESQSKD